MAKMSESLQRAQANYQEKCKVISIRFNRETEADLIDWLEVHAETRNAGTIIKNMIRQEIERTRKK